MSYLTGHYKMPKNLTRKEFILWLKDRKDKVAGYAHDGYSCPLANWLKNEDKFAGESPYVSNCIDAHNGTFELPPWARKFVGAIDSQYYESAPVAGFECLEVLGVKE